MTLKSTSSKPLVDATPNDAWVICTDFSQEDTWKMLCEEIKSPDPEFGFVAYVHFIHDETYKDLTVKEVVSKLPTNYPQSFVFIIDTDCMAHKEHPIKCIGLGSNSGLSFLVLPSAMWSVENNLSIANMDFQEFVNRASQDGIFRGF